MFHRMITGLHGSEGSKAQLRPSNLIVATKNKNLVVKNAKFKFFKPKPGLKQKKIQKIFLGSNQPTEISKPIIKS